MARSQSLLIRVRSQLEGIMGRPEEIAPLRAASQLENI